MDKKEKKNNNVKKVEEKIQKDVSNWQFDYSNKQVDDYLDNLIHLAENLIINIKTKKGYIKEIREGKDKHCTVLNCLDWAVNDVENMIRNISFSKVVDISKSYTEGIIIAKQNKREE
ncbi:unnamed protein product [marine sediment metagenome]|uniref:Uncharacterized protein n=1 Tax=marine sediment metagenome TaxID=412755 RepID=X1N9Y5_9ZZZZ